MEVANQPTAAKKKGKFIPRIQKNRLAEIEANLKLLLAKGVSMKKSDAAILATAPRELLRPITMELYASLTSFEKAEFRQGCRKVVNGQVKIDKDKLRQVLFKKDEVRLDKLRDFVLRRRQQRQELDEARSDLNMAEPGALLKFGAIRHKQAKYAMTGKNAAYAFAAKIDGLENDLKKRKSHGEKNDRENKSQWGLPENVPSVIKPEITQDILHRERAELNIKTAAASLTTAYTYFLEKCRFSIGEKMKATIKRRCDHEGFLVEVCGKICALHVSQLFVKLDDFAEPMSWFHEGQEVSVFIRDVLELEQCPFLKRVKGLSGNLIASTTLIPPDNWLMKVPAQFVVYKCQADKVTDEKMSVCLGPTLKGCIPYQNWDDKLLVYAAKLNDGTAINVFTFRLERNLSKFTDFVASRVPRDECREIKKDIVLPIIRMNVPNILLPCKSRFNGWKVFLPLTEADDDFSQTDRGAKTVLTLGVIIAANEKKKVAIVSTRVSRLKKATRETSLFSLLPKGLALIEDRGIANARLLHDKKGSELRGFVVKKWEENRVEVLLGMDYIWPLLGHLRDESGTLHKRLKHLAVVKVRLLENTFETKDGVPVELADGSPGEDEVSRSEHNEDSVPEKGEDPEKSISIPQSAEFGEEEGFDWEYDAQPNLSVLAKEEMAEDSDSSTSSDGDDLPSVSKKSKREREEDRRRREAAMREAEAKVSRPSDTSNTPTTAEEFDRLVMASPSDGSLWVRYMAHHLQQLEIEKARQVAKRGLKLITGNEADKLSLWLACLNLENLYGTQESLESVCKEALKQNDPIKVYSHLAKIYALAGKIESARETYQMMLKKFKNCREVWIDFGSWLFDIGCFQEARQLMKRSFNSLTDKEHIEVILKYAQFEFTKGERDFGKSLMDNLLLSYPKKLNLWIVYIDQLIKTGDLDAVRINFNKLTKVKLPLRKMKSVFKKWLDFEAKFGTPESLDEVKQKVESYITE